MENPYAPTHPEIRDAVRALCLKFDGAYWRKLDRERGYPTEFVKALTEAGWLATLIPEEYGGAGLGISAAAAVLEEVQRAGCNGATRRCTRWAPCCVTAAPSRSSAICRASRAASFACRRSG
jgi:alkylation response protein AidB-like acyl-CoA dehydrogenase